MDERNFCVHIILLKRIEKKKKKTNIKSHHKKLNALIG